MSASRVPQWFKNIFITGYKPTQEDFADVFESHLNRNTDVVDNLASTEPKQALSANQGKILKDLLDKKADQVGLSEVNCPANTITRVAVGTVSEHELVRIEKYLLKANTLLQSGGINLLIAGGILYPNMGIAVDNNNGDGLGIELSFEISSIDHNTINLVINNTTSTPATIRLSISYILSNVVGIMSFGYWNDLGIWRDNEIIFN